MSKKMDLTGMRVGRLTVVSPAGKSKSGRNVWNCRCDCGNETVVLTTSLATERTKSCGCLQREKTSKTFKKHGQYGSRLYKIWSNMIQRCSNPKHDYYSLYGARGVSVCDEWKHFDVFYEWATQNGYAENLTIDRIDNDTGYCPENCRWATPQEQTDNRRCSIYLSCNGKRQTLRRWSDETGIPYKTLLYRYRQNWPIEKIFTKRFRKGRRKCVRCSVI